MTDSPSDRLFLFGDAEPFELLSELGGRMGYAEIHCLDDDHGQQPMGPSAHVLVSLRDPRGARVIVARLLGEGAQVPGYLGLCATEKDAMVLLLKLSHERVPKARLDAVRAPAGHGIGATTPEEIAVAIAAELIAARRRVAAVEIKRAPRIIISDSVSSSSSDHDPGSGWRRGKR